MRQLMLLVITCLLSACATTSSNYTQTVTTWRGGNVKTLFERWGTPNDQAFDPSGNTAYFYTKNTTPRFPSTASPSIGVNYSRQGSPVITTNSAVMNGAARGNTGLSCTAIFTVNKKGQIINTEVHGVGCNLGGNLSENMINPNGK